MSTVAALSQHPSAADATAELVGQLLDQGAEDADLAVLFSSPHHTYEFEEIVGTIRALLRPGRLVGVITTGIIGGDQEIEEGPALSLLAANLDRVPDPVRLTAAATPTGVAVQGLPEASGDAPNRTVVLLGDPYSLPVTEVLDVMAAADPATRVVGGLSSGGIAPGRVLMVIDDDIYSDGAVGVVLDGAATLVSQGCRPVGTPMIVTRAEGNQILELAGESALARLEQLIAHLSPEDKMLLLRGLHVGVVADEHKADFDQGDFLVRSVTRVDRAAGGLTIGGHVEVGTTVQFQLRDAASADEDLRRLLSERRAGGALVFTCNGRGRRLFGTADHDAQLVAAVTAGGGVAGMFCGGEIGPVGTRSFLHSFSACVVFVD